LSNLAQVYGDDSIDTISHEEIATLININRELFTSNKALVMCFKIWSCPQISKGISTRSPPICPESRTGFYPPADDCGNIFTTNFLQYVRNSNIFLWHTFFPLGFIWIRERTR
jgi:hypothetical protein